MRKIFGVLGLVGAVSVPHSASALDQLNTESADCKAYRAILVQKDGLESTSTHLSTLRQYSEKCSIADLSLGLILRDFFKYWHAAQSRDTPCAQCYLPGTDLDAIYAKNLRTIDKLLPQFKKYPKKDVFRVLQAMVNRGDDSYMYARGALEIAARDFPESYDGYKSLTPEGTKDRWLWEENRKRWITHESE